MQINIEVTDSEYCKPLCDLSGQTQGPDCWRFSSGTSSTAYNTHSPTSWDVTVVFALIYETES